MIQNKPLTVCGGGNSSKERHFAALDKQVRANAISPGPVDELFALHVTLLRAIGMWQMKPSRHPMIQAQQAVQAQIGQSMRASDYVINLVLSVILIVGVYQFYFWCQRNHVRKPREFRLPIDDSIPYWPRWVWIYSCLYYPIIVYINFVMGSPRQFNHVAMSFMVLLMMQMVFFVFLPVAVPEQWRIINQRRGLSERFLAFVQKFDARSNSFPSMHTSVATLTALHLYSNTGPVAMAFPALIALSCLFTKQHYILDLPAGAMLGGLAFWIYQLTYSSTF